MKLIKARDFYPLWLIALIKTLNWFSTSEQKKQIVKSIAFAAYQFSKKKRRFVEKNLSDAFAQKLNENREREIVKGVFHQFWEDNFSLLTSRHERTAIKRIAMRGVEHLRLALENGRGVILWESNSFGNRALSKQILHEKGFPIHQVHGHDHFEGFMNPYLPVTWVQRHIIKRVLENFEKRYVAEIISLPGSDSLAFTRILLDRLNRNVILCVSGDAHVGQKQIPLEFLRHTVSFPTGMVSLAKISGAPILPIFCIAEKKGQKCLIIERPICIDKKLDRERGLKESLSQYVSLLESYIRKYPEHFKSWHLIDRPYPH